MTTTIPGESTSPGDSATIGGLKTPRPSHPLVDVLREDRVRRRLSWPAYARLLGLKESTLYKIARGYHVPREVTEAIIRGRLADLGDTVPPAATTPAPARRQRTARIDPPAAPPGAGW
jgi:hypothetical protein